MARDTKQRRGNLFAGLPADARFALRMLARHPWSTLSIAATLALGIGATTAIYAVFNFVLFRPVPGVPSESALVTVVFRPPDAPRTSAYGSRAALPLMREVAGLERLGFATGGTYAVFAAGAEPTFEECELITSEYFSALGVRPHIGRLLTDDEANSGSENVAVVSERLWRTKLGGAQDALGKTLTVNGVPFVVVGVVSRYRGWGRTRVGDIDVWLPIGAERAVERSVGRSMTELVGRVRDGASPQVIEQQLRSAYAGVAGSLSARDRAFVPWVYAGLYPSPSSNAAGLRLYWLLMGGVLLLLVLSCANAANLLLARVARREREMAVRLAIGAGRLRIIQQLLVESLGLAGLAGAMGVMAAILLTKALEGMRLLASFPELQDVPLDGRVIGFCLLVTMGTVVAFGLAPALMASRTDIRGVHGRSARTVASPHRFRSGLVIAQLALSLTLLAGAGVFNRSLQNLFLADLGANLDDVIALSLRPDDLGYDATRSARVVNDTIERLRQAGFGSVAVSYPQPLTVNGSMIRVKTDTMVEAAQRRALDCRVSPDYFNVLGIPLLSGRTFTDAESREAAAVNPMPVIVNAKLATDLFGTERAVGRMFDLERFIGMKTVFSMAVVIGVAGDTRSLDVRREPQPVLYHTRESGWRYGVTLVRDSAPASAVMERIRGVVHEVDPALPITSLRPLRDDVAEELSEDRVLARTSGLVALLAALLAATGVISVVTQLVTERTREFGIRTALGASSRAILRQIVMGVAGRSLAGVALGLGLYWGMSRWLETRLYGIGPLDPATLGTAVAALIATAVVAALFPAFRATRVDPAVALRAE